MRRRLSLTAALVLLLSLLCACAAQHAQEMDENGYELYFLSDPNSAGGGDAIRTQEKRLTLDGAMETEDCVRALMEALLAGPDEPSLSSPIPEGTALKSLKVSGRRAQIDLSAQYARLTGIDLSLADYCITLTLTQLPNVNAVSITADGRELPYRETQVLLSADTLLSSRESGLRPITVSLYFLDSKTGELRAEQQTLALYEGQTRVNALLEALAQGPEDDSLVSLLPEDFAVISSRIENGVCYLNLPANVSLPENEAERDLMLSALEQSILSLGGVDEVIFGHFDERMQHMDWRDFIHKLLIGQFHAGWIISGRNNRFGYKGLGNAEGMAVECEKAGIGYDCIEDIKVDGIVVSSTYIRQLIAQGDMEGAAKFLGHPYTVTGIVEHGRRVGTSVLKVPTVNLRLPSEMALPPYGVYATRVLVDGKSYIAATNIGVKPTFVDGGAPTIEPHLLDFSGDLYGKMIHVELHKFLRPEKKFDSVDALRREIEHNIDQTRAYFAEKNK